MVSETEEMFDLEPWRSEGKKREKPLSEGEKALNRVQEIEERSLKNLENRANRGERLTAADYAVLQDLKRRFELRCCDSLPEHVVSTAKAVAEFFGRTVRTIRNWAGRGMPQLPNGYDLQAIEDWALKEGVIKERKIEPDQGNAPSDSAGPDRSFYELEIKRLDSELKAIKLQRETGALISRHEVERGWIDRAFEFKRDLMAMARRLSLRAAGKKGPEIYEIIRQDSIEMLKKYARGHVEPEDLEGPENGTVDS